MAIGFQFFFFITFALISFRSKLGTKLNESLDKPLIQRISAWIGVLGFVIGITAFLIVRMWFGKAAQDFNASISFSVSQSDDAPDLKVVIGNGFTSASLFFLLHYCIVFLTLHEIVIWVAFAFYAAPLIVSLSKLNATFNKA